MQRTYSNRLINPTFALITFIQNRKLKMSCEDWLLFLLMQKILELSLKDKNQIKVIKELRKDIAILKPDKGNGVVVLSNKDYTTSVGCLFIDNKKFKALESDPTIMQMKTLQSYLSTLQKRNELTKEEYNALRPKNNKTSQSSWFI